MDNILKNEIGNVFDRLSSILPCCNPVFVALFHSVSVWFVYIMAASLHDDLLETTLAKNTCFWLEARYAEKPVAKWM